MTTQHKAIAIGAVLAAIVLWRKTPLGGANGGVTATVTTSEGFDLSEYGGPVTYPAPIVTFAQAVARAEGFYVTGSVPQRANNPGDLKKPGYPTLQGTSISYFDSVGSGWDALYYQLYLIFTGQSSYYNLDMTIRQMADNWTASDKDSWAGNVAGFLGVDPSTPLYEVLA